MPEPPPDLDPRLEPHLRLMAGLHLHPPVPHVPVVELDPFDPEIGHTTTNTPGGW